MVRFSPIALIAALVFLSCPKHAEAAVTGPGLTPSIADALIAGGMFEPVHYSGRWGWHCGMGRFGHSHPNRCWGGGGAWWRGPGWRPYGPAWRGRSGCRVTPWGAVYCRF
jgi:hypothetical protein